MGMIKLFSSWSPSDYQSINQTGNPNPKRFKIKRTKTKGKNCLILINFPDCLNCEGNKILLIKGMTGKEVKKLAEIDPHFDDSTKEPFIIARFHPSKTGWELGINILEKIFKEDQ